MKSRRFVLLTVVALVLMAIPLIAQEMEDVETLKTELSESDAEFTVIEEVITFENEGGEIVGTLTLPESDETSPIILLFHGFTGTRDELPILDTEEAMFSRTARLLAEYGYANLRIDFRGSGESDGEWEDTTFSSQISDAFAALDFVETLDTVDTEQIGIIGLSQGGLVAASIAADPRVDSVVLWSPVANPPATYSAILGNDIVQAGLESDGEAVDMVLPWDAEISLKTGFFEDLYYIDPIAEITAYEGPLMVVVGDVDDLVTPQPYYGQTYINYHDGEEMLVVMEGAGHVFNILEEGPEKLDEVVFWTLAWFESTLMQ